MAFSFTGSTTDGLFSDLDGLYFKTNIYILEDLSEWKPNREQLLMEKTECPGYRSLMILSQSISGPETNKARLEEIYGENHLTETKGRFYLKNTFLFPQIDLGYSYTVHGPAICRQEEFGERTEDLVKAFFCQKIPSETQKWIKRTETTAWPSEDMKKFAIESGCYVVPVGHKASSSPTHEWRLCTSMAEREYVFCMNITQIRCLILLKMLMKSQVNIAFDNAMKSYFIKTALFYKTEESETGSWTEENLLMHVTRCLIWLQNGLERNCMPHYFMPDLNMLEGRFSEDQRKAISELISKMSGNITEAVFAVGIDEIGLRLRKKLCSKCGPLVKRLRSSEEIHMAIGKFLLDAYFKYCRYFPVILLKQCGGYKDSPEEPLSKLTRFISKCLEIRHNDETYHPAAERYMPQFYSQMGTLKASAELKTEETLSEEVKDLLMKGSTSDMASGKLRYASALYCSGNYEEVCSLLNEVEKRANTDSVALVCGCDMVKMVDFSLGFRKEWERMLTKGTVEESTAFCVFFLPLDLYCVPEEFRGLFYSEGNFVDFVSVDPVTYLYGLQFLTFRKLDRKWLADAAYENLSLYVQNNAPLLYHNHSALIILESCRKVRNT